MSDVEEGIMNCDEDRGTKNTDMKKCLAKSKADDENGGIDATGGKAGDPDDPDYAEFLLVVFGKTGTGKSLLTQKIEEKTKDYSKTQCECTEREPCKKKKIKFCVEEWEECKEVKDKIRKVKKSLDKHNNRVLFLFCVRSKAHYPPDELRVYQQLKDAWDNDEDLSNRLLIAITRLGEDSMQTDRKGGDETHSELLDRGKQEVVELVWPQIIACLIHEAKNHFLVFDIQMTEDKDIEELITFARQYTPLIHPCWRVAARYIKGWLKRHNQKGLFGMVLTMFLLQITEVIMGNLDLLGDNSTAPFLNKL